GFMEPLVVIFVALFARERNAQATNMVPMSTIVFIRLLILVSPDLEKVKPSRAALIGGIMCPTTCLALASLSCFFSRASKHSSIWVANKMILERDDSPSAASIRRLALFSISSGVDMR